jgi:hypothetical protein
MGKPCFQDGPSPCFIEKAAIGGEGASGARFLDSADDFMNLGMTEGLSPALEEHKLGSGCEGKDARKFFHGKMGISPDPRKGGARAGGALEGTEGAGLHLQGKEIGHGKFFLMGDGCAGNQAFQDLIPPGWVFYPMPSMSALAFFPRTL